MVKKQKISELILSSLLVKVGEDVMSRIINGFLRTNNRVIENDDGKILLRGWGIGNWLLCEGYMWNNDGSERMDRPRRIENIIVELLGNSRAKKFWERYRENYFSSKDVRYIRKQGYNSIRVPINWRLFMEDEPGVIFKEDGFKVLDKLISWCKEEDIYVFLDLHGAPGGQTGENIDDCIDNFPRLFMDEDKFEKGISFWEEIARRYSDEEVIAGYDLLNEPLCKEYIHGRYLVPELVRFYKEVIARIRKFDKNHLIALEGHNWATNTAIFNQNYDSNYVIHFHRYAVYPEISSFKPYLDLAKKWNVPLWLGETGESKIEWFSAITQICEDQNISYHFWPYKKMGNTNCSLSIDVPENWDKIIGYSKGQNHPGYRLAEKILNDFLNNMLLENTKKNQEVDSAILRNGNYILRGTDYAEIEGSYLGFSKVENLFNFRIGQGFIFKRNGNNFQKEFLFDTQWDKLQLLINKEEYVSYYKPRFAISKIRLEYKEANSCKLEINNKKMEIDGSGIEEIFYKNTTEDLIRIDCLGGSALIESLEFS